MGRLRDKILFFFFLPICLIAKLLDVQIETPYAILVNAETGKVLFEKQAKESVYPASTTKIATALYVLKTASSKLDEMAVCSDNALKIVTEEVKKAKGELLPPYVLEADGTMIHLKRNERMSLRELLYGAMLSSGNDASNVIAEYISGDILTFVKNMNEMIVSLGCKNTHFCNPHGLFHVDHKTTAYDMAILTREALKYPIFREIVKMPICKRSKTNLQNEGFFTQNNALVKPDNEYYYPLAIGIKTGYLRSAKYNLVSAASNGEREVIVVLHKSPTRKQRYIDAIALFEAAFCEPKVERLIFAKEETSFKKMVPKAKIPLLAVIKEDVYLKYYPSEEEAIEAKLDWHELNLPIEKGSVVAELTIFAKEDGRPLLKEPLVAKERVARKFIYIITDGLKAYFFPAILPLFLVAGVGGFVFLTKRKDQ